MATTVTRYVDPRSTGGDGTTAALTGANAAYASLAAWELARRRDLVAADEIEEVVCDSDGTADTTAVSIDGANWTTDATRFIRIKSAAGSRPGESWSNAKYRLVSNTDCIGTVNGIFLRLDGLQLQCTNTSNARCIISYVGTYTHIYENCFFRGTGATSQKGVLVYTPGAGTVTVRNCVFYDLVTGCEATQGAVLTLENNTYVDISGDGVFNFFSWSTVTATNCGFSNVATQFTGTVTATTCSTTTPSFVDYANDNFALTDGDTTWRGAGTDLSGTFTTDLLGGTRTVPFAIGAFQTRTTVPPYDPDDATRTTWTAALRDPHIPMHWLLELLGDGAPIRYADADLVIGGELWAGALEMQTPPGIYVDPYTSQASSPNTIVRILPIPTDGATSEALRPYDLEQYLRLDFLGWRARLYRYADHTSLDEAELLLDGFIHEPSLEDNGVLTLTIVDRILRHNRRLPRFYCNTDRWADMYGDDAGQGYSILYGKFYRVPCPVIDTVNKYALVGDGTISSVTTVRVDDAADAGAPATLATATDAAGKTVSRVTLTAAVGDSRMDADGEGYADDADGTYTGTASALIEHPADQLYHLLTNFVGVREADIDRGSFLLMRSELSGWKSDVQILGDYSTDLFSVTADLCSLLRSAVYAELGKFTMRHLDFTREPLIDIRENENLLAIEPIETCDRSHLITKLVIHYGWHWLQKFGTLGFARSYEIEKEDYDGFARNHYLLRGDANTAVERMRLVETRAIQAKDDAEFAADKIAELHGKPRKIVKCTVQRDAGHLLRIFDCVTLTVSTAPSHDGTGWDAKRFIVTGITYGLGDDDLQLIEC